MIWKRPTILDQPSDIDWALSVHAVNSVCHDYQFAVLYGNEDCPDAIEFWYAANPHYLAKPDWTWTP